MIISKVVRTVRGAVHLMHEAVELLVDNMIALFE